MSKEIRLPEISENVDSGDVVKVMVAVGDFVEVDQPLLELETEKAVFEVPSTVAGKVAEILVSEGDTVKVGQVLVKIDESGESGGGEGDDQRKDEEKKAKKAGKDKEGPEETAAAKKKKAEAGKKKAEEAEEDVDKEKADAAEKEGDDKEEVADRDEDDKAADDGADRGPSEPAPASPSVRRLARELGIDIHDVEGAGPGGRISNEDVRAHAKRIITGAGGAGAAGAAGGVSGGAGTVASVPLPDFSRWGEVEREPMSKVRAITADRMAAAWNTVPHVTQYDKADITDMEAARKKYAKKAEDAGGKLTMTAILTKVVAAALEVYPQFNASVDVANQEIIYKKYVNIGIAVDTDRGLLVPVIRDADRKNIVELSVELTEVADKARTKKIKPDEMEGGNFTISNLGGIGGTYFSPIVYAPEAAILGVSRAVTEPVFKDGKFVPRLMLPLSLSYDHRLIDGADAARFIRWVSAALEDPFLIALEG